MENENGTKSSLISNTENESSAKYTIPGILHFIQHEWARFEMERAHWEVERAELQARIAFLQGERKGQENLKHDLIRRIKMLEYALQQERNKYFRLKYGKDSPQGEIKQPKEESLYSSDPLNEITSNTRKAPVNWRQGRQLLRQYLQEVGYTDTVLDVRSSRVRSILGLSMDSQIAQENIDPNSKSPSLRPSSPLHPDKMTNGGCIAVDKSISPVNKSAPPVIGIKRLAAADTGTQPGKRLHEATNAEESVLATFDFLANEVEDEDNDSDNEGDDGCSADDESDEQHEGKASKTVIDEADEMLTGDEEAADALEEFDFLVSENSDNGDVDDVDMAEPSSLSMDDNINITMPEDRMPDAPGDKDDWKVNEDLLAKLKEQYKRERKGKKNQKRPPRSALQVMLANLGGEEAEISSPITSGNTLGAPSAGRGIPPRMLTDAPPVDIPAPAPGFGPAHRKGHVVDGRSAADEAIETALGLGDLAGLTVANEADPLSFDVSAKEEYRKTWNPKFTLRSHFDGIRSLCFHPVEHVFFTASEDHTLKLWNLQKTVPQKKSNAHDVEPVFTFRKHSGPVLCTGISPSGETLYSGSSDSTIQCWKVPNINLDPYGPYDPTTVGQTLLAHTDAVWDLAVQSGAGFLLSCSADGTCRLWNPNIKSPLLNTFQPEQDIGAPTSVDFIRSEVPHMVASYSSSSCVVYDLETAKAVVKLESNKTFDNTRSTQINKVISHPTLPLTITAHEDRYIRFFDNTSGKQIHSMVAHLDAVTSLAIDPNGLYLLSGSHDCSIRLWNLDTKTCVQEITSHRKKFDESIFDVTFHPTKPYIASAGADGLAKIFV